MAGSWVMSNKIAKNKALMLFFEAAVIFHPFRLSSYIMQRAFKPGVVQLS